MKKILLFVAVCISTVSFSQSNTKMDFYLAVKQSQYAAQKTGATQMLPMLIQGNINGIKQLVKANGGIFKYSYGDIAAIVIPVSALDAFNESSSVTRMEGGPPRMHVLDDTANVKTHIREVLGGQSPLTQAYDGKGIVIGFIDSGIDYLHEDFRDSTGTRVKFYWDMNRYTNVYTPLTYGYGQAWNKAQLDANLGNDPNDSASILESGHGSNVADAAVGNGKCNGREMGGCPKADIIAVAFNFQSQNANEITDAVNYIYTCADSLHEPCVINASLGGNDGSHDDSDLQGKMIDQMIMQKQPGRAFVAAAGNSGVPYHVHDSLKAGDTTFTWFLYDAGYGIADIPVFANKTDFNNIKFKLRCDKVQVGSYSKRDTFTVYSNIASYIGIKSFNVYNANGQRLAKVQSYGQVYGKASYSLEFQIQADSTGYYWGFQTTGTGKFDCWDYGSINGVKDTLGLAINPVLYPGIKHYKQPDTMETICSSYQCSPYVITAQTYYNRQAWTDCNGTVKKGLYEPGGFVQSTSRGPTRNAVHMKPDVAAPGSTSFGAYPTWFKTMYGCTGLADTLGCHYIDGGTSMASPMVAAAAALYMEKYPTATDTTVKRCLDQTAYNDIFTGPPSHLPNPNWGYGKLNAFDALTQCSPPAGILSIESPKTFILSAYPNPFSSSTIITFDFSSLNSYNNASIVVYDIMGNMLKTVNLKGNRGDISISKSSLASGIYFYSLVVDGARLKTGKLEVM